MKEHLPPHKAKEPEDWLSMFKIEVTSSASDLYNNGNQQIEVTVTAEPVRGETITDAQLRSITLYTKEPNGSYRPISPSPTTEGSWAQQTERDPRFDYYDPGAQDGPEASTDVRRPKAELYRTFYVSSRASSGSTLTVSAGIDYSPTIRYHSDVAPYQSTVVLTARNSRVYDSPEQFTLVPNIEEVTPDRYFVTYRLQPIGAGVAFAVVNVSPNGMIRWQRNEPGNTFATIVGWVEVGTTKIRYEESITRELGASAVALLRRDVGAASANSLILFMQADNRFPYHYDTAVNYQGPLRVSGADKQGHLIRIAIRFKGDSRNELDTSIVFDADNQ